MYRLVAGRDAIEMTHDSGQNSSRWSKTQMIVILHQRIGENFDFPQPMGFANGIEEGPKSRRYRQTSVVLPDPGSRRDTRRRDTGFAMDAT